MIGRFLIDELLSHGYGVTVIVRPESTRSEDLLRRSDIEVVEVSIKDYGMLAERVKTGNSVFMHDKYDVFYHLAWANTFGESRNDVSSQAKNIEYALDAVYLADALGCKTFLGAGSQAEYGRVNGLLNADTPAFPENGYGIAKLAAGDLTRILAHQLGIKHVWARILSVYGPYDGLGTMISSVGSALLRGEIPELTPCEQTWDYLYAEDAACALYLAADKGTDGAVYCIGGGEGRPLLEYVSILRDEISPHASLRIGAKPYSEKQVMCLIADISDLTRDTGFLPKVPFEKGIKKTIDWLREQIKYEKN